MPLKTTHYTTYQASVPTSGKHILAQCRSDEILVYQAYNHQIADYAVANQVFGGENFSYARMSWIKPNFLWMMFRCGWATKPNQERVLGIWLKKSFFEKILEQAVFSSFQPEVYADRDTWQKELRQKEVRLQWDPDHDLYGNKLERRAIQLGLKGDILKEYGQQQIQEIIDLTDFVREQKKKMDAGARDEILVLMEKAFLPENRGIINKLGLDANG
jgi:hypothetical protein